MAPEFVTVGFILCPHGLRGEFRVRPASENRQRFSGNTTIRVLIPGEKPYFAGIEWVRFLSPRPRKKVAGISKSRCPGDLLIKLARIDTLDQAEKLSGAELVMHPRELEELPEGEYYHFDLIGLSVTDDQGEYLGILEEIFPTGNNDVYVVRSEGAEILLPAIDEVILRIDLPKKTMIVHLLEGLV